MAGLLVVNPFASGVDDARVAAVRAELTDVADTLFTEGPDHAREVARKLDPSYDRLYVFSGDGTYNEVLNGLVADVPLGLVPGGGTSVLPRALGLPRDPVAAARRVASGSPRRIGLGRVNGHRFAFNAGIGLDAELVRAIDGIGRADDGRRPGDAAFVRAALGLVARRRGRFEPALAVEGMGRAAFVLVANCAPYTYLGRLGLRVAPDASFGEGLDLVAPRRVTPWTLPRLGWHAWRGARGSSVLVAHDADRLVIRCDGPMPLQTDGEDLGDVEEAIFEAERDAVAVLV